jgi:hypothetical protein
MYGHSWTSARELGAREEELGEVKRESVVEFSDALPKLCRERCKRTPKTISEYSTTVSN